MAKTIHSNATALTKNGSILPYGAYDDLIADTSTSIWDNDGLIIKRRRSQRKTWVFCGAYAEDLMVGIAIADVGYAANAFAYFYVPSQDIFIEDKVILPMGFDSNFDPTLTSDWNLKNFKIQTHNNVLTCSLKGKFDLKMEVDLNDNGLSFICPSKDRPFNFTYKNLCLPTRVEVKYKQAHYNMKGNYAGIDFSKGYPPRSTFWNWASVIGKSSDGRHVGMNLFRGHNEKYENAAWIDGQRILLSNTTFIYNDKIALDKQETVLETEDGLVALRFYPSGKRAEKINAGMISHDFVQAFGKFEGSIKHNGESIDIIGYGPLEKHFSKW